MATYIVTDQVLEAAAEYRRKFGKEFPLHILPQNDEADVVAGIRRYIDEGRPAVDPHEGDTTIDL